MTLNEALQTADEHGNPWDDDAEQATDPLKHWRCNFRPAQNRTQ